MENALSTRSDQNAYFDETVRKYFSAYQKRERSALEKIISDRFTFEAPTREIMNRDRFFEKTWPAGGHVKKFHVEEIVFGENEAYVLCETEPFEGEKYWNTQIFKFENNRISSVVQYLGMPCFV